MDSLVQNKNKNKTDQGAGKNIVVVLSLQSYIHGQRPANLHHQNFSVYLHSWSISFYASVVREQLKNERKT